MVSNIFNNIDKIEGNYNIFNFTEVKEVNVEDEILELMRSKRSIDEVQGNDRENDTIKFYHAVDELNEGTY